jgi:hypothetical protein
MSTAGCACAATDSTCSTPATRRRVLAWQYGSFTLCGAPIGRTASAGNGGLRRQRAHATPAARAQLAINKTRRCPLQCCISGWGRGTGKIGVAALRPAASGREVGDALHGHASSLWSSHQPLADGHAHDVLQICAPCVWLHRAVNSAASHEQRSPERRWLQDAACSWRARESLRTARCIAGSRGGGGGARPCIADRLPSHAGGAVTGICRCCVHWTGMRCRPDRPADHGVMDVRRARGAADGACDGAADASTVHSAPMKHAAA